MTHSTERSRNDYKAMQEELRVAGGDAEWRRDEAEEEGDMETYAEEVSNRMVYQSAIRSYNDIFLLMRPGPVWIQPGSHGRMRRKNTAWAC